MTETVIFAPGSMTHLMPLLLAQYLPSQQHPFRCEFGPSGLLREKIEMGARCDIFLSATISHTKALGDIGILKAYTTLALNQMVLVHSKADQLTQETALDAIIAPEYALGMSTTGLDPAGDYAFEILARVSHVTGMDLSALEKRTRVITGGRETPNAPPGRNQYGWIMETQDVDLLLTYYSNALAAINDNPNLTLTSLPQSVAITGVYGAGLTHSARLESERFYHWLGNLDAQRILEEGGFGVATTNN